MRREKTAKRNNYIIIIDESKTVPFTTLLGAEASACKSS